MKFILPLLFFLTNASYAQKGKNQNIDSLINQKMKESGIVGLGAGIIVDKNLVWTQAYGYADKENKILFTPNTIMNIGSISKTITGVCLMRAIEDGKLSLDEDINKYLPFKVNNPFFPEAKITLRQLATHTSGITDQSPLYDSSYYYGGDSPQPLRDFLKKYFDPKGKYYKKENFLNYKPGTHDNYSNIATALAGYIIEIVTGEKLNEYSKQFIFQPLHMNNTGWFLSEINVGHHTKLYNNETDTTTTIKLYGLTTYPDGGVRTSVLDLSKFLICILKNAELDGTPQILKKESIEEMLKPEFNAANRPENMDISKDNMGIFWAIKEGGSKIGHRGADPGVNTYMYYDITKQVGVILFMNTSLGEAGMEKFFSIYNELWKYGMTIKEKTSR